MAEAAQKNDGRTAGGGACGAFRLDASPRRAAEMLRTVCGELETAAEKAVRSSSSGISRPLGPILRCGGRSSERSRQERFNLFVEKLGLSAYAGGGCSKARSAARQSSSATPFWNGSLAMGSRRPSTCCLQGSLQAFSKKYTAAGPSGNPAGDPVLHTKRTARKGKEI